MTQPALQLQLRRFETLRAFLSTRKVLILLVELVGIEPTTSSLRTMRSPSFSSLKTKHIQ